MILANMKKLFVTIMTSVLTTLAALILDVFTVIIPTNVLLQIIVMMLTAIRNKDVLLLIPLTAVTILTSAMNLTAILKSDVLTRRLNATITMLVQMTAVIAILVVSTHLLKTQEMIIVLNSIVIMTLEYITLT
jgi:hypothetical protein